MNAYTLLKATFTCLMTKIRGNFEEIRIPQIRIFSFKLLKITLEITMEEMRKTWKVFRTVVWVFMAYTTSGGPDVFHFFWGWCKVSLAHSAAIWAGPCLHHRILSTSPTNCQYQSSCPSCGNQSVSKHCKCPLWNKSVPGWEPLKWSELSCWFKKLTCSSVFPPFLI